MSDPAVTKADVTAACEGMLRKQLYVVFTTPAKGLGPVMENIEPHLAYQVELKQTRSATRAAADR